MQSKRPHNKTLGQPEPAQPAPLEVVDRPISSLKPHPRNPRRHSREQIRRLARSIQAFGFNVPVLVDREDRIVAGHARVEACRLLGRVEVPTIRLEHLTERQAQAFLLVVCTVWRLKLSQRGCLVQVTTSFCCVPIGSSFCEFRKR